MMKLNRVNELMSVKYVFYWPIRNFSFENDECGNFLEPILMKGIFDTLLFISTKEINRKVIQNIIVMHYAVTKFNYLLQSKYFSKYF